MAFQSAGEKRTEVPMAFSLAEGEEIRVGASGVKSYAFGFDIGPYDNGRELELDPEVFVYCGFIGGSKIDAGEGVAVDGSGNAYITGEAVSSDFPVAVGPDLTHNGAGGDNWEPDGDIFVAKLNPTGTALLYCGYIGGNLRDASLRIAVDGSGNAYIGGWTRSNETTFPVTIGPDLTFNGGDVDAFVAKINSSGTALVYCGYIGGSSPDDGTSIAVDGLGNAFIVGQTQSTAATFPVKAGPDLSYNGGQDGFIAKVNASGTALDYCGYIGGSSSEDFRGVAVDAAGNAYVAGSTNSTPATFPVTVGPDLTPNGGQDVFVAKVDATGTALIYCGYIGGAGDDYPRGGLALDGAGNIYVTGRTTSTQSTFPVIVGPDLTHNGGAIDIFVAKINHFGTALDYCGFIGGSGEEDGDGIAVDGSGNAFITGYTTSDEKSFPVLGVLDLTYNGSTDAFVALVNQTGSALVYCSYIGGSYLDVGFGIAVDGAGDPYVVGQTASSAATFPDTVGPYLINRGGTDAFVAKLTWRDIPTIQLNRTVLNFGAVAGGVATSDQKILVSNSGTGTLNWGAASNQAWLNVTPASGTGAGILQISVNAAGLAAGMTAGGYQGTVTVTDPNASNSPQTVTVNLIVYAAGTTAIPYGDFATPLDGTTGITGAIPVTGWVADDVEVVRVEILRDNFAGETPGQWAIGDAIFVEGARPDIEVALPNYPLNYRAGWGYMMLTNMLPGQGNGTVKLYAYATDKEGNRVPLGTKTIVCDNAHATKPFGTLDSPTQGGEASGAAYPNWGWVLTPLTKTVPVDGSTILVYVDGALLGNLSTAPNFYNAYRPDISLAFPGLNNTGAPGAGGPVGLYYLNTTGYANGVHTIQWVATDNGGGADGIGSRYFTSLNIGAAPQKGDTYFRDTYFRDTSLPDKKGTTGYIDRRETNFDLARRSVYPNDVLNLPSSYDPLSIKRGFDRAAPAEAIKTGDDRSYHVDIKEVELLKIYLDPAQAEEDNPPSPNNSTVNASDRRERGDLSFKKSDYTGYVIAGDELRPLPIGSMLDARTGLFSWLPGPGFIGAYDLVFVEKNAFGSQRAVKVKVTIKPKF